MGFTARGATRIHGFPPGGSAEMLQPMAANAQALLSRVVEQAAVNDGGKPPAGRRGRGRRPALELTDKIFSIR